MYVSIKLIPNIFYFSKFCEFIILIWVFYIYLYKRIFIFKIKLK